MMPKRVILPTASSYRRQPLLQQSQSYPAAGTRLGEAVGGTAAVCCCFSFGLANMAYLTLYKVPASLCQKALQRKKRRRRRLQRVKESAPDSGARPRRCSCWCCDDIMGCGGRVYPLCSEDDDVAVLRGRKSVEKDKEVVELEKEMWERFYGTGFWRSPSQRQDSSQHTIINTSASAPNLHLLAVN